MANTDKNIKITPSRNRNTYPTINFTGASAGSSIITLEVLDDNTLSFSSNEGQVFSIDSNLSTGTIWAVSDISGVPMLSSSAGGTVGLAVYGGIVAIGQTNPTYKLDLKGSFGLASSNDALYNFIFSNSAVSGSNSLQVRYANSIQLFNSGNTFYTALKSNASANVTYTLPAADGSADQFLKTNGSGTLSWGTPSGGAGGGGSGVGAGGQYEIAYYPGTGSSVIGNANVKTNTSTSVVSIGYATAALDYTTGALTVTGGVGIGGSLFVGGIGASISGVTFNNSNITKGVWQGTVVGTTYGGLGANFGSATGILTISSGTVSNSTTSSALANLISDKTGSGSLVFATGPTLVTPNIGAATGTSLYLSATSPSNTSSTGALIVPGGVGVGLSVSIGGRLQLFNGANYTAFVSAASGNTFYTLPPSTPAVGTSVLQSDNIGNLSWVPMTATGAVGAGSGTVAIPGAQYQIAAYYAGTGASVSGSTTFTNNVSTNVVNISHNTVSTSTNTGALTVTGGLGLGGNAFIGGTINVASVSVSAISGISFANGIITSGKWSATAVTGLYGGTGYNSYTKGDVLVGAGNTFIKVGVGADNYVLTASSTTPSGVTWASVPPSAASSVAITPTVLDQSFWIPAISSSNGTGPGLSSIVSFVINPSSGVVSASGISVTSTTQSTSTITGALKVSGGAGIAGSVSIGGRLQLFSGGNYTAFVSSASGNTFYTLPPSTPAVGTSVLQSDLIGNLSWVPMSTGTGSGTVNSGTQYHIAYYAANGTAVSGSSTFTNDTVAGKVSITHNTASTSTSSGALAISGGLGLAGNAFIGGTINVGSSSVSVISGVSLANGIVTVGSWSATAITGLYGGTGYNSYTKGDILVGAGNTFIKLPVGADNYVLTASNTTPSGITWAAVPASSASSVAVVPTVLDQSFWIPTVSSSNGTGLGLSTIVSFVINPSSGIISASGLAITSNTQSTSTTTGALRVFGGVGVTGGINVAGPSTFKDTTASTSQGTGAVLIEGGLGVSGQINAASMQISGNAVVNGNLTFNGIGVFGNATSDTINYNARAISSFLPNADNTYDLGNTGLGWRNLVISGIGTFSSGLRVTDTTVSTSTTTGALIVSGGAGIAGSLFTGTGFSSSISGAILANGTVNASTYNKVTVTAPTSSATLTLSNGSSLITSGGHSLTFTTTNATNVTVPTTGTLATTSNKLSDFAATTSSELLNTITGETGSGALTFATSPTFTTSVDAAGATFAVFNTTATTINAFGAATTMSIGAATGKATFNSTDNSTSSTTGALAVSGGAGFAKSVSIAGRLQMFNGADYTAFVSAANGNTTYTLPPITPAATGTSVLSSTPQGVMSWVPMVAGTSGGSPSGSIGDVQYNSGTGSFAASTHFTWVNADGMLKLKGYNLSGTSASATNASLLVGEGGDVTGWSGSATGTILGLSNTSMSGVQYNFIDAQFYDGTVPSNLSVFKVDYLGRTRVADLTITKSAYATRTNNNTLTTSASQTTNITYVLPLTLPAFGSSVLYSDTSGNMAWVQMSGGAPGGSGTVNSGIAGSVAFYSADGTAVSGSNRLSIATSGLAITANAMLDVRSGNELRLWEATNARYTGLGAGNVSASYDLLLPTAKVGAGASSVVVGADGQMYFVSPGSGIAFSTVTGNLPTIRSKRAITMQFCAGYTPTSAGADSVTIKVPDSAADGITDTTYLLKEFDVRVETPSSGSSRLQLEKFSDTGALTYAATGTSMIGGFGITLSGAGIYFTSTNVFAGTLVTSNNKLRVNWTLLNATHANFSIQLTMEEL